MSRLTVVDADHVEATTSSGAGAPAVRPLVKRVRLALAAIGAAALVALTTASGSSDAGTTETAEAPVPLAGFTTHVRATHFLGRRAYQAEHYFKQIRPGVLQGLVVRRIDDDAPIIEVEWAISSERYRRLPARLKRFWHPLAPAVDAGRVRIPGASAEDEREALAGIRDLYAQTLNLAGLDGRLPRGVRGVRSVTHLRPGERHHR